jgi:hypothetical protein
MVGGKGMISTGYIKCWLDDAWARVYNIFVFVGEGAIASEQLWREITKKLELDRAEDFRAKLVSEMIDFQIPRLAGWEIMKGPREVHRQRINSAAQ